MHALILLLTGLVCAQSAPQFVFVLPPEFLKQMQKPVGETSQPGQQPRIPFFPLESLLRSSSTLSESVIPAPVIPETLQATKRLGVPTPVVEEQQQTEESAPVVTDVVPPTDVIAEAASETVAHAVKEEPVAEQVAPVEVPMVEEAVPVVKEAPAETTMVQEAAPLVQEAPTEATVVAEVVTVAQGAPAEVVIMEEVVPVVQEVSADTLAQEVTADPTIAIQTTEPTNKSVLDVTPVEEAVTPAIVESVTEKFAVVKEIIVEDVMSNTAQEVVIVEEVIPNTIVATTQGYVAVSAGPVSSIKKSFSAPTNEVVDPRFSVDPRFRNYIYENDAPDVVAAKIALFNLQAASFPRQHVQEPKF